MPRKHALFVCWVLGSASAMVIGVFGPWMSIFGVSNRGIDGLNDGWLVVFAAVAGGAAFVWKRDPASAGVVLGCGCLGGAAAIYDRWLIGDTAKGTGGLIQVGWGVNLAVIASISLAAAGLVWILTLEGANASATSPAGAAPVAWVPVLFAPDEKSTTSTAGSSNATDPTS